MLNDPNWLQFSNMLLKIADIDSFEIYLEDDDDELLKVPFIKCNYHKGVSYEVMFEEFTTKDKAKTRFVEIKQLLGMYNG